MTTAGRPDRQERELVEIGDRIWWLWPETSSDPLWKGKVVSEPGWYGSLGIMVKARVARRGGVVTVNLADCHRRTGSSPHSKSS